jgi:hypothetical protein
MLSLIAQPIFLGFVLIAAAVSLFTSRTRSPVTGEPEGAGGWLLFFSCVQGVAG